MFWASSRPTGGTSAIGQTCCLLKALFSTLVNLKDMTKIAHPSFPHIVEKLHMFFHYMLCISIILYYTKNNNSLLMFEYDCTVKVS